MSKKREGGNSPSNAGSFPALVETGGEAVVSLPPTVVATPTSPVGLHPETLRDGFGMNTPAKPATVVSPPAKRSGGGWEVGISGILPLPSSEYPPTGMFSGIPRDTANNKVDTAGYACYAFLRKHAGKWFTPNEVDSGVKSTYRILAVGNFAGGVSAWCWWMVAKKPIAGVVYDSVTGKFGYGIPLKKPEE